MSPCFISVFIAWFVSRTDLSCALPVCFFVISIQSVPLFCFACVLIILKFLFRASPCCVLPVYCGFLSRPSPWSVLLMCLSFFNFYPERLLVVFYLFIVGFYQDNPLVLFCLWLLWVSAEILHSFLFCLCVLFCFYLGRPPCFCFFLHFCCLLQINESMFLNSFSYSSCQINISHYHNSHML